jgi:hypothetical protein
MRNVDKVLTGTSEGKRPFGRILLEWSLKE